MSPEIVWALLSALRQMTVLPGGTTTTDGVNAAPIAIVRVAAWAGGAMASEATAAARTRRFMDRDIPPTTSRYRPPSHMGELIDVCREEDLPSGDLRTVEWEDIEIMVVNCGGELLAIEDRCS